MKDYGSKIRTMDFNNKKAIFGVFIVVLILIAAGFYYWRVKPLNEGGGPALNLPLTPITPLNPIAPPVSLEKPASGLKIPDLDRPIKITANLTDDERQKATLDIEEIVGTLKGNSDYFDGWLQLGILRKMMGDYEGAVEAWEFAGVIRPKSTISFLNLADLYAFYIRNNALAEKSFAKAISADPKNGFAYFQAASFHRDVLQDTAKAKEILERGISAGADPDGALKNFLDLL